MAKDDTLRLLTSEFNLWNVKFSHREIGSGHIELRWRVTPDKEARSYVIAKTPGDHRGGLNARADIRRLFRADGLTLEPVKKLPALHKALAIPTPVEPDQDQIRMLRAEVADLTEMVLELVGKMDGVLSVAVQAAPAPAPAPPPITLMPVARGTRKQPYRGIDSLQHVSEGWTSISAIARDMGVPVNIVYRKLRYLLRKGVLERSGERWRRAPRVLETPSLFVVVNGTGH